MKSLIFRAAISQNWAWARAHTLGLPIPEASKVREEGPEKAACGKAARPRRAQVAAGHAQRCGSLLPASFSPEATPPECSQLPMKTKTPSMLLTLTLGVRAGGDRSGRWWYKGCMDGLTAEYSEPPHSPSADSPPWACLLTVRPDSEETPKSRPASHRVHRTPMGRTRGQALPPSPEGQEHPPKTSEPSSSRDTPRALHRSASRQG